MSFLRIASFMTLSKLKTWTETWLDLFLITLQSFILSHFMFLSYNPLLFSLVSSYVCLLAFFKIIVKFCGWIILMYHSYCVKSNFLLEGEILFKRDNLHKSLPKWHETDRFTKNKKTYCNLKVNGNYYLKISNFVSWLKGTNCLEKDMRKFWLLFETKLLCWFKFFFKSSTETFLEYQSPLITLTWLWNQ